ncbi:MAG: phosphodiester glycosidase family protein [Lachnospiraceae bacterium]|jgi:exopolysaccharide biosynthesis protein|nr:phosphodiester glycosidase family protein [Lachnospiraceae bacterium]
MSIKRFFARPYRFGILYSCVLTAATVFVLLDAFVIPKAYENVQYENSQTSATTSEITGTQNAEAEVTESTAKQVETSDSNADISGTTDTQARAKPVITETSYDDENISINIETTRINDTTVHIADIIVKDVQYLKTALANNQYGRNIDETTSEMASEHNAIFAINGDYYGFRDNGYVLRNGNLYRTGGEGEALVLDLAGNLTSVNESEISEDIAGDAWQIWSFGPTLVEDGEIAVGENSEISGKSAKSNPRTAIGQIGPLHYVAIVSEGRTSENAGLSLYQLAEVFVSRGCTIAYNLDGGGSSTMVFNGQVINNPTTNGRKIKEREVSDIIYVGYQ